MGFEQGKVVETGLDFADGELRDCFVSAVVSRWWWEDHRLHSHLRLTFDAWLVVKLVVAVVAIGVQRLTEGLHVGVVVVVWAGFDVVVAVADFVGREQSIFDDDKICKR